MYSPTSHVLSNNVQSVKVIEGPMMLKIWNFKWFSKSRDKEPTKDVHGEVNLNAKVMDIKKRDNS